LNAGARLGPYEIVSPLGVGGMGEVYRARDTRLDRTVAIKVLPTEFAADPDLRARFEREARAIAALDHPHICALHDVGEQDGVLYLVMQHLDGETLQQRLARTKGPLPIDQALTIAIEIADALDKAHRAGITHRDLKPANIMLTKSGAKLLDFGLAKLRGAAAPISMSGMTRLATATPNTAHGTILGTVHYMAPEQVEGREADARADIWSLGVVLYEMLTGTRPFEGTSAASVIVSILKDAPPPITTRQPLVPRTLDHIVARCLERDPEERWQTAADINRELRWVAASPVAAAGVATTRPATLRLPWIVGAAVLAALAAIYLLRRTDSAGAIGSPSARLTRLDFNLPLGVEFSSVNSPAIAFSPDGERLAVMGMAAGVRQIYVRRLDQFDAVPLGKGTDTANDVTFSPDGSALAFVTVSRSLRTIAAASGLVTTLADGADSTGAGLTWGADGQITYVSGGELWQVPASGGSSHQLTTLDRSKGERAHLSPFALPDGRGILFTVVTGQQQVDRYVDMIAAGVRHRVVEHGSYPLYSASGHLLFYRDGSLLAAPFKGDTIGTTGKAVAVLNDFALDQVGNPLVAVSPFGQMAFDPSSNATKQLVWVSRTGAEEPLDGVARPYQMPRLSPDGHRVVVEVAGGDLWMHDTARKTFTRLTSRDAVGNTFPVWTPDSHRVVFRTLTGLRWIDPDGDGASHPIQGSTTVADIPTSISLDGRTLAYINQSTGDVFALSLDGDPAPHPVVQTNGYDGGGQFSPDGRWLAYASNESGEFNVYLRPYPGPDRKFPVSTGRGTHPRWNPNGKELFYRDQNKMMAVDVTTTPELKISEPHLLFERRYAYGGAQTIANFDVSPDGQRFLMVRDESSSGRLGIVLNWFDELRRRVPVK
jgi:serine/threonine-protein kinase